MQEIPWSWLPTAELFGAERFERIFKERLAGLSFILPNRKGNNRYNRQRTMEKPLNITFIWDVIV